MISLCLPSRERPERIRRMINSARATAKGDIEFCICVDTNDPTLADYPAGEGIYYDHHGGGHHHSDLWNLAYREASGNIAMVCADDLYFRTEGWDLAVGFEFAKVPDKILHVWCNDGTKDTYVATHPFVSRRWIELAGFFTPPYFDAWYADTWLLDLALKIGRSVYIPEYQIEHEHVLYGTAPHDRIYERGQNNQYGQYDNWLRREPERMIQAERLFSAMDSTDRRIHDKLVREHLRTWNHNPEPIF